MALVEIVVFPLYWILFGVTAWDRLPFVLLFGFLGTIGFCVLGTLFSALTLAARLT
jgi:ABC-type transport system involved in cytochrome c biogenesis permease component